jgi:hypothetical protein
MDQDGPRGRAALLALHDLLAAADRAIDANDHTAARQLLERAGTALHHTNAEGSHEPFARVKARTTLGELRALLDAVGASVETGNFAEASDLLELLRNALSASRPSAAAPAKESPLRSSGFRFLGRRKDAK